MKQTAHEVRLRAAESYWRIYRLKEVIERARCVAHERVCSRIVKEARALEQGEQPMPSRTDGNNQFSE